MKTVKEQNEIAKKKRAKEKAVAEEKASMRKMSHLLYDELMLHACARPLLESQQSHFLAMTGVPVYDLSNVVPLFDDNPSYSELTKRPPHDRMWAEWDAEDSDACYRVGVFYRKLDAWPEGLVAHLDEVYNAAPAHVKEDTPEDCASMIATFQRGKLFASTFYRQVVKLKTTKHRGPDKPVAPEVLASLPPDLHCPSTAINRTDQFVGETTVDITTMYSVFLNDYKDLFHLWGTFNKTPICFTHCVEKYNGGSDHKPQLSTHSTKPMELAFTLLHCKNVVVDENEPVKRSPHFTKPKTRHKPSNYRTISLTKPRKIKPRGERPDMPEANKVRFHLCRGHFKNLQSTRYAESIRGLHWWPAHWRGDEKVGVTPTRYKVTA